MHTRFFLPAIAAGLTLALSSAPAHAQSYSFQDVGSFGGTTSIYGMNNLGQVVGSSQQSDGLERAFLYDQNGLQNLGLLPGGTGTRRRSFAGGINDSGVIVGSSYITNTQQRGFRYTNGTFEQLNPLTGGNFSQAIRVNASGVAIGSATSTSAQAAVRWDGTTVRDLGNLGGFAPTALAYDINASGQIAGFSQQMSDGTNPARTRAFRTAPNANINAATDDLGTLGGTETYGMAINSGGMVAGYGYTASGVYHAFRTGANQNINAATDDLGILAGYTNSYAGSINTRGEVVGNVDQGTDANGNSINSRAVLFQNGGIVDLNSYVPSNFGWTLTTAGGINDRGQIIADGVNASGVQHGFLITPTPAPPGIVSLLIGAGVTMVRAVRRRKPALS